VEYIWVILPIALLEIMNDITSFDLIKLIGAENWKEDEKEAMISKFTRALGRFLLSKFMARLTPADKEEMALLLAQNGTNEAAVVSFLNRKIPNIATVLEKELKEFKTMFVTAVYQNKIEELKVRLEQEKDSQIEAELEIWINILRLAQNNEWEQVVELLRF